MKLTVLSKKPFDVSEGLVSDFLKYAPICDGDGANVYLDAASQYIETKYSISLREIRIEVQAQGGRVRLPFQNVQHIESVKQVSGHGVPMNYGTVKVLGCHIELPELRCGGCYLIKYKTSPIECEGLVRLALFKAAFDLYEGQEVSDLDNLLVEYKVSKIEQFYSAVGGMTRRIR